jgi:hypothetical protein
MDFKRQTEKKRIFLEIRQLEDFNKSDKATISRFMANTATDFSKIQVKKLSEKIENREQTIFFLKKREIDVNIGNCDKELNQEVQKLKDEIKSKKENIKRKKVEMAVVKEANSVRSKAYYHGERQEDRKARYTKKDADRAYIYFTRICDNIPDYMLKKLSNMPANKGYIWKDVYCYGNLRVEDDKPIVMFERTREGAQRIHEWNDTEYRVYEIKRGRKELIKNEYRKLYTV